MRLKMEMAGLLLLFVSVFAAPAFAIPVNGGISFGAQPGSSFTYDGSTIDFSPNADNANVTNTSGDFSFIADSTPATFFDFAYNPFVAPTALWEVSGLTFYMTSLSNMFESSSVLLLEGVGYLSDGVEQSSGSWNLTLNSLGGTFSFSSSAEVPEPSSLALLGLGVLGMGLVRRRSIRG